MNETFSLISALNNNSRGLKFYIVGGAVRDYLLSVPSKDIDIVVQCKDFATVIDVASVHGEVELVSKHFPVLMLMPLAYYNINSPVEIALTRSEVQTGDKHQDFEVTTGVPISEDSNRRDFSVNAIYYNVENNEYIDFHDGKIDLKNKLLRFIGDPEQRISEDPLRMLRAFSLAAKLGFTIEKRSLDAIRVNNLMIARVSPERIRDEFIKLLMSNKPSTWFRLLYTTGLLRRILPELNRCYGIPQEPEHHKFNVFDHILSVIDHSPQDLVIRLGALCHDLGKAFAFRKDDKISFKQHEDISVNITKFRLRELKFPSEIIEKTLLLVANHMYRYNAEWKNSTVAKFARRIGLNQESISNHPLFQLRKADRLGKGFGDLPNPEQEALELRLKQMMSETNSVLNLKDLDIDGCMIMENLHIQSGPLVGQILAMLLDAVINSPGLNNRDSLVSLAKQYYTQLSKKDE